ncbi:hypothetical protein BEP19_02365 [Ammoniphilus oxalaticus]|uniref:Energy-coupling factor transporter transmembrane protein EcfT n=1 Tax=Ammoniphilus oxalaticus TaxID=66863 RepID=A0A419SNI0_9BACL|nr:energy-coupling factor transporter transmembrane component T [Ammoniphilus oxalaticus]RKD25802.1 hypothetical protein BEP19_02365 [Ammoniphilus oxalaticus]
MNNGGLLFQSNTSYIGERDPRSKILFAIAVTLALIINNNLIMASLLLAGLIVLWKIAELSWKVLFIAIGSVLFLFLSTMIYHIFILPPETDTNIIGNANAPINLDGIYSGLSMCLQIAGIIIILTMLVLTTSPIILAEGMEALMKPLKKIKFPVHEGVMMFTISIRFLPILANEFDKIRKAQIARGNGFHRGTILKRARGIFPLLMPMFVQSILRAEELATAMDARCYQGDRVERTPLRLHKSSRADIIIVFIAILLLLITVCIRLGLC